MPLFFKGGSMAAVVPIGVRMDQMIAQSREIRGRARNISIELLESNRRGSHLIYESSPLVFRIDFLHQIPPLFVDIISNLAKTIFFGVLSLVALRFDKASNFCFKHYAIRTMRDPVEIGLLLYAVIRPSTGIDYYYDFKVRTTP
jgi:hypothetical protein